MTLIHNHINIHQVLGDGLKYNFSHMFALNIMFQQQQKATLPLMETLSVNTI